MKNTLVGRLRSRHRRRNALQSLASRIGPFSFELLEARCLLDASPIVSVGLQVGTTQQLNEISGVAVSRSLPGNLWVHQDSGDTARFYGLTTAGVFHSTITLSGAPAVDWEDMTISPKPGGGNYLFFGDFGDNSANRVAGVDIIRVTEPTATGNATLSSADYKVKRILYPGAPSGSLPRNAESLFVDPLTSDLYIISKQTTGGIYRLPAGQFDVAGSSTLESFGNINAPLTNPTAADISPDGKFILVRNSALGGTTSYLFQRGPGQSVADALQGTPTTHTLRSEPQGEAVGWNVEGSGFYSISEGTNRPIWFYTFDTLPTNVSGGGPYTIFEGAELALAASATGIGPLTYSWDVNNDGIFGDASGVSPTLTWSALEALGITDGSALYDVRVKVDNGAHPAVASPATLLTISNVAPTADPGGPYVIGAWDDLILDASASSDPGPADVLSYSWDLNGDSVFGDAAGINPTITAAQLAGLGITPGSAYNVSVQVSDGEALSPSSVTTLTVQAASSVVGRHLFYNQSGTAGPLRYDGNDPQINANDDLAIATDKVAFLPASGASTFANVSSYTKGINGIMVDIAGTHGTITAADFIFRVGNNNTPNSWVAAPAPSSISVRAGAGQGGSDRVVLTWANGAITRKWLEVIVLANGNTGIGQKAGYPVGQGDVFFFGNAVANSGAGDNATQAIVNVTDELGARNNPATLASNIPITNLFDYNRDGQVNTTDALASRNNPTNTGNVVRYITVANPPAAPGASPASDDGGVASALSTASAGGALAGAGIPRWLVNRLQNVDLNSGPIARYFEHLARQGTLAAPKAVAAVDQVINALEWEDERMSTLDEPEYP